MEKTPGEPDTAANPPVDIKEEETQPAPKIKEEAPESQTAPLPEDVPDPDEDDLDDLDDMLDEFTPSKTEPTPAKAASGPGKPPPPMAQPLPDGLNDEDFAKQFQAGLTDLMGELETSPDMAAQFEAMMKEFGGAAALGEAAGIPSASKDTGKETKSDTKTKTKAGTSPAAASTEESFQETIKKTMERMRNSGDQATAAAASEPTEDILAEMMKAMSSGALDGEGGEEEFSKMLMGMMEQLTNKEILYEPMKELDDKFPDWMEKNKEKTPEADMTRYKEQEVYVMEIVQKFEEKTYSDDNAADREYIVDRMQKMQAAGSPPPDLVGDMEAAQQAFGAPEESCPTQ